MSASRHSREGTASGIDETYPALGTAVGGKDPSGNLVPLNVDASGNLKTASKGDLVPSTPTFATVGTSSAQAVAANTSRTGLVLINTSTARISLAFGTSAVLYSGITLNASGGTFEMDEFMFDTGAVHAIASAAGANLGIQEYT